MTEPSPDTGMGSDLPVTTTRSIRRTRRVAIIGALALVLVAGAVLVGVKTTGARSGALLTSATRVTLPGLKCKTAISFGDNTNLVIVGMEWQNGTLPTNATSTTTYKYYYMVKGDNHEYQLAQSTSHSVDFDASGTGLPYLVSWGSENNTADTTYDKVYC